MDVRLLLPGALSSRTDLDSTQVLQLFDPSARLGHPQIAAEDRQNNQLDLIDIHSVQAYSGRHSCQTSCSVLARTGQGFLDTRVEHVRHRWLSTQVHCNDRR